MSDHSLFVATPLRDGRVTYLYLAGALQAMTAFAGRIRFEAQVGGFLPMARDTLTAKFLDSGATHMLNVDADVGWSPDQAQQLLDTGKDVISGCYSKRDDSGKIPAVLNGKKEGDLFEAESVPAGFLLLSRAAVERMAGAYRSMNYRNVAGESVCGLWANLFEPGRAYAGEDISFCERWRRLGGQIWLHPGVVLQHLGEKVFLPEGVV